MILEDIKQFCLTRGKFKPLAEGTTAEPPKNILAQELEDQGYRVEFHTVDDSSCLLDIGWQPKPKARIFFTGILEYLADKSEIRSRWRLPGPIGVNHLLRQKLEELCGNPLEYLSPAARKDYLAGLEGEDST
jgi:hypothetical protein